MLYLAPNTDRSGENSEQFISNYKIDNICGLKNIHSVFNSFSFANNLLLNMYVGYEIMNCVEVYVLGESNETD